VQLIWSFIMGMTIEEIERHVEGNMALLWDLIVDLP
jgi:hypothetical protein